jgi:ribosomal protein S26
MSGKIDPTARQINANRADLETENAANALRALDHQKSTGEFDMVDCLRCSRRIRKNRFAKFGVKKRLFGGIEWHYSPCGLPCCAGQLPRDAYFSNDRQKHGTKGPDSDLECPRCGDITEAVLDRLLRLDILHSQNEK